MSKLISTIRLKGKPFFPGDKGAGQKDMSNQFFEAAKTTKVDIVRLVEGNHVELSDSEYDELLDAQNRLANPDAAKTAKAKAAAAKTKTAASSK